MRLYWRYLSIHLKSQMQYKFSFFMTMLGQFLTSFAALVSIWFLMDRFQSVAGFTFGEVVLCFSIVNFAFSVAEGVIRGFDLFSTLISNGEFDRILTRPRNEMFQVLASRLELTKMGRMLQAVLVLCYALPACGVVWTADKIAVLILMVLAMIAIFAGMFIIYAALCFFTTEGLEFINIFTDGGREHFAYPISVYGNEILRFFTYVVPFSLAQYYPLLFLTGRSENPLYAWLPALCFLFLIPCWLLWRVGVRHYKSTGS